MSKRLLIAYLIMCFPILLISQDLIKNTRKGISTQARNITPNKVAEWMERDLSLIQQSQSFDLFESSKPSESRNRAIKKELKDPVFMDLKAAQLTTLTEARQSHLTLKIPVTENRFFELYLKQTDHSNGTYILNTSEGIKGVYNRTPGLFYRGYIKGNPNSWVALSVFEDYVRAIIADDNGNYVLGKLRDEAIYVLYNDKQMHISNKFTCHVDAASQEHLIKNTELETNLSAMDKFTAGECMPVYIEADFHMYNSFSSNLTNVQNYVNSLFNETATLYMNAGVKISLSEIFVHTTTDPYAGTNNIITVHDNFSDNKSNAGFNGELAHLITTRDLGGGFAWIDAMCAKGTGTYGPYALSANLDKTVHTVPTYSQDVTIFAHEMGHNWSNYHTHDCGWGTEANPRPNSGGGPIDCCGGASEPSCNGTCNVGHPSGGGTIMSYCHLVNGVGVNFNKGFHPVVRALMQSRYNSKTCTVTCPNSCPSDLTLSNETLSGTKEASNSITTSGTVSIGEETTLSAPTVTLNSGFTCAAGKSLTINTTGCTAEALAATYIPKALKNVLENEEIKATKTTNSLRISPNPFRKRTTISYEVAQEGPISLAIFDNRGRLVKQLIKTVAAAGVYTVDYQEDALEEGLFYIVFRTATGISSEKIIMLK